MQELNQQIANMEAAVDESGALAEPGMGMSADQEQMLRQWAAWGVRLGHALGASESAIGRFWAILGRLGDVLGPSWDVLGGSWEVLGRPGRLPRTILETFLKDFLVS